MTDGSQNSAQPFQQPIKAIDVHCHAFPDDLAKRALQQLKDGSPGFDVYSDGTAAGLLRQMDAADVHNAVIAAIATKPTQAPSIFRFSETLLGERFIPFPSIHPEADDALEWVNKAAGVFRGLKIHPQYQGVPLDSPGLHALLREAARLGLVILMHAGQDPGFPGDMSASPEPFARMLDAAGDVSLIAAHLGGWRDWEQALDLLAGRETLYLDTSASLAEMAPDLAREIIARHGPSRVLFGSDSPWNDIAAERRRLESLNLAPAAERLILRENAADLLSLPAASETA